MAYLERVRSKGKIYLYLKQYEARKHYENNTVTIYAFGRIENALKKMRKWKVNYNLFPEKLKKMGFCKNDLKEWIIKLEHEN